MKSAATTVETLKEAGAKVVEGKDGRVRLLFTPEAREVVEKVKVTPYVQRVSASENLRFALEGGDQDQPAWGKKAEAAEAEPAKVATAKVETTPAQ